MISLKELLVGSCTRLRAIQRFSTTLRVHDESVAEHSFFVAFYALHIARYCTSTYAEGDPRHVSVESVLSRALCHDLDESYSGDFYRGYKYENEDLRELIEEVNLRYIREELAPRIYPEASEDSTRLRSLLTEDWRSAKEVDDFEGRIVAFADFLSVVSYIVQELRCGNREMLSHYFHLVSYGALFEDPDYLFIRPLVKQTIRIIQEATH